MAANTTLDIKRLSRLREAQGWTQDDLAHAAGVSGRTVQRVEAGDPLSLETLRALASAFDVHPNMLRAYRMTKGMSLGVMAGWTGMLVGPALGMAGMWMDVAAGNTNPVMLGIYGGLWGCAAGLYGALTGWMIGRDQTRFRTGKVCI